MPDKVVSALNLCGEYPINFYRPPFAPVWASIELYQPSIAPSRCSIKLYRPPSKADWASIKFRRRATSLFARLLVHIHVACLNIAYPFQSNRLLEKKREHFHKRNALLRTPHPLREHYRKLLMPTPIRSELRSLRHSRNSYVVFQEDAKNYWPNISKKNDL